VKVRLWDDAAKVAGAPTRDLAHFEGLVRSLAR
jgi:predicted HD phosphohydrolase